jgi:hypothetical protein
VERLFAMCGAFAGAFVEVFGGLESGIDIKEGVGGVLYTQCTSL